MAEQAGGGGGVDPSIPIGIGKLLLGASPGLLERLVKKFKRKNSVIVLGSTGTGKSQLITSLTDLLPESISYLDRTSRASKDLISIDGKFFNVWDTPGQQRYEQFRIDAIRRVARSAFGVINVVCWGYHEYRAAVGSAFLEDGSVSPAYLARHREIEIEQIESLVPHLRGRDNLKWFITVVTKADLWWHEHNDVFKHYEQGEYANAIQAMAWRGIAVLDYSSVSHPFYGRASLVGNEYSDDERRRARAELLSTFLGAVGAD